MVRRIRHWSMALIAIVGFSNTSFGNNDFFKFRVTRFPFQVGKCSEAAQDLAQGFASVTGTRVTAAKCLDTTRFGADIQLTYIAEKPLQFITTYNSESANPQGIYKTWEACLADSPSKVELFRKSTALEPVASYCMHERTDNASDRPYVLNVIGAGDPAKYYRQVSLPLSYGPLTAEDFLSQVRNHLQAREGLDLSHVELSRDQYGSVHLLIGYYAEFVFRMQEIRQIIFTDPQVCQAEIPHLEAGLTGFGASLIASTCQMDLYDSFMLRSFYIPGPRLMLEDAHREFESYAACVAERQNVLEFLSNELKWDVSSVICVKSDSVYALAVRRLPQ